MCRAAWVGESVLVGWRGLVVFFHRFNRLDVRFFTSWPFARRSPRWPGRRGCKVDARFWPVPDTAPADAGKHCSKSEKGVPRRVAFSFGIERFDDGQQFRPWDERFRAREKLLAAGDLLFIRKLGLGKTGLMGHALKFMKHHLRRRYKIENQEIKSAFP